MPEPIQTPPPALVPTSEAVTAAAKVLVNQAGPFTEFEDLPAIEQFAWKKVALEMLNAAAPELIACVLLHVAENAEAFGLDALDSLFDFTGLARNVRQVNVTPTDS